MHLFKYNNRNVNVLYSYIICTVKPAKKDSLIFPLMNSAYTFNLYIKGKCSIKAIFLGSPEWPLYTGLTVYQNTGFAGK